MTDTREVKQYTLEEVLEQKLIYIPHEEVTLPSDSPLLSQHTYGGVYLFKDSDGLVLYVGMTDNIYRRITSHLKGYGSPDLFHYKADNLQVTFFREDEALYRDIYESYLIYLLKPRYNVGKTGRKKVSET